MTTPLCPRNTKPHQTQPTPCGIPMVRDAEFQRTMRGRLVCTGKLAWKCPVCQDETESGWASAKFNDSIAIE